jgi:hypothetical protein
VLRQQQAMQGHLLRCRPGLDVGRGDGHAVPGEGFFDSGEAVGLPPAARAGCSRAACMPSAIAAPIPGVR